MNTLEKQLERGSAFKSARKSGTTAFSSWEKERSSTKNARKGYATPSKKAQFACR